MYIKDFNFRSTNYILAESKVFSEQFGEETIRQSIAQQLTTNYGTIARTTQSLAASKHVSRIQPAYSLSVRLWLT